MKSDSQLQQDVMAELDWEPSVHSEKIGVAVSNGVVTLSGYVNSYLEKLAAERAAKRVSGVKAVAQDIKVKLPTDYERTDAEIAGAAINALDWNVSVPRYRVKVTVQDGWITLSGEVDSWWQKDAAETAVCGLLGVRGITDNIKVKAIRTPSDVKGQIEKALLRRAQLDAQRIKVEARNDKVILSGTVHSWDEWYEVGRAACAAPGVCEIENKILVQS